MRVFGEVPSGATPETPKTQEAEYRHLACLALAAAMANGGELTVSTSMYDVAKTLLDNKEGRLRYLVSDKLHSASYQTGPR